jgi:tRNA G18 (ribose-2'-O)-methylase SpoU
MADDRSIRKLLYEEILDKRLAKDEALNVERHPVIGVLEDIRSLYNVGACFRTADAMLLEALILTGYTPTPPRAEIAKTALGATETVPWKSFPDPAEAIEALRARGCYICALELTDRSIPLDQIEIPPGPIALVVGNELTGVRSATLAHCDSAIEIPMYGMKHSLNVSVAFGIAVWELVRLTRSPPSSRYAR